MTKIKVRSSLIIVLAMACCALFGIVGFRSATFAKAAPAEVKTVYTESNVVLTQAQPYTLKLTSVPAGQYFLNVNVDENVGTSDEWYFDIYVTEGDVTKYLSYNYNEESGKDYYTGVVNVTGEETIQLGTTSQNTLTTTVTLQTLYLGEDNNFDLPGVNISKEELSIDFLATANDYTITVDILNVAQTIDPELVVKFGEKSVTLTRMYEDTNIFTGVAEGINGNQTMTISANDNYTVNIAAEVVPTYEPLPESAELTAWNAVNYSYKATGTGYYKITATSDSADYSVAVTLKTDPTDFEGLNAGPETPLYMEAYNEESNNLYYFEVILIPEGAAMGSANVTFSVTEWTAPTIKPDTLYEVPVTLTTDELVDMNIEAAAGTYNLTLTGIPNDFYVFGDTITANIGTEAISLTAEDGYVAEVELTGNTTISLTASQRMVVTLDLEIPEVREYITLDKATEITLNGGESALYYIHYDLEENPEESIVGYYNIALSKPGISVYAGYYDQLSIVPMGETEGGFRILYDDDYPITLTNNSESSIEFTFTVSKAAETVITLGSSSVSVPAGKLVTYFAENLLAGTYTLEFSAVTGTSDSIVIYETEKYQVEENVYAYRYRTITITDNKAVITVNEDQDSSGIVMLLFKNNGAVDFTSSVTVRPNNSIQPGEVFTVSAQGAYSYSAYYFYANTAGTYALAAKLPEGMSVSVTANYEDVVYYGGVSGVFTVDAVGYVTLRFNVDNYGTGTSFDIYIDTIYGAMTLGETESIELFEDDFALTYSLGTLKAGRYSVEGVNGVNVAANGYLLTDGTFEVTTYEQVSYITFFGTGAEESFDATVKLTDSYILTLGKASTITMSGYGYREYYIEKTAAGNYTVTLSGETSGISVRYEGSSIITEGATTGTFTVSETTDYIVLVIDNYGSDSAATFTLTVTANA